MIIVWSVSAPILDMCKVKFTACESKACVKYQVARPRKHWLSDAHLARFGYVRDFSEWPCL